MNSENPIFIFDSFIPQKEWPTIRKISIKFKDVLILKWISFNNTNVYRRHYLKVTYKNQQVKHISISLSIKNDLKQYVKTFNQHLQTK
jgi:hypothetical protein